MAMIKAGDYVRIEDGLHSQTRVVVFGESVLPNPTAESQWWWWVKLIACCLVAGLLGVVAFKWVGPFIMAKVVIPFISWEARTVDTSILPAVIFGSIALFPVILFPSSPSMWVAGMSFGYEAGFLLVMAGVAIGVTLPYFIGSLNHVKIHRWLEKYPEQASALRLAGQGSWYHQFQAVILIRISPFPYVFFNYAAVAANIAYTPYLLGSLVGVTPEVVLSLYSGIVIRALADTTDDSKVLSKPQAIHRPVGLWATLAAVAIIIAVCVTMRLCQRHKEEEELLIE